jgi:hypothetical protein
MVGRGQPIKLTKPSRQKIAILFMLPSLSQAGIARVFVIKFLGKNEKGNT